MCQSCFTAFRTKARVAVSFTVHHASVQREQGVMQPCGSCFVCHARLRYSHAQPRLLHKQGPGVASAKTCNETGHETTRSWKTQSDLFSRTVTRKRPLADHRDYRPIAPDTERLLSDIKQLESDRHSLGLRQILDDSTDSATSDDAGDTVTPDISY